MLHVSQIRGLLSTGLGREKPRILPVPGHLPVFAVPRKPEFQNRATPEGSGNTYPSAVGVGVGVAVLVGVGVGV